MLAYFIFPPVILNASAALREGWQRKSFFCRPFGGKKRLERTA